MALGFNSLLGLHEHALNIQANRTQLIGANLANADTPGYKARDLNFKMAMQDAESGVVTGGPLKMTRVAHIQPEGYAAGQEIMYRMPTQPSLDGNSVESHVEMAQFTENSIRYLTSLRIVSGRLNKVLSAFRGE